MSKKHVGAEVVLRAMMKRNVPKARNPGKVCEGSAKMVLYFMSEALNFDKRKGIRSMETKVVTLNYA